MKRKFAKGCRKGTRKRGKTTEKTANEFEDDCSTSSSPKGNMDMQPKPRTRSQAAAIAKCPVRTPALEPEKETKTKSLRLTRARRCVEKSDRFSTNRGKQPIEEFTDESAFHENQDFFEKFLAGKNSVPSSNELVQNILSSTIGKEKTDAQEAHSVQLTEMAAMILSHDPCNVAKDINEEQQEARSMGFTEMVAMMNSDPLDADVELHQPRNSTIPSSAELIQSNLPCNVAKDIDEAQKAHSMGVKKVAAMMNRGPLDAKVELHHSRNPTIPFSTESVQSGLPIVAKEINEAQEAHRFQLMEMAPMVMNHVPSDAGVELHQPRNPTNPSSAELIQSKLPCKVAKDIHPVQQEAHSMGFTEMEAIMCHGPSDDEEEADSSSKFISVEGYIVKKETAPILKKIIDKYKDIAKDCTIEEKESQVPILEMICDTCQKLRETSFNDVNDDRLKGTLKAVEFFQSMGFDVKWLSERVTDIRKLKRLIHIRHVIDEAVSKQNLRQKKIEMLEHQLSAEKADFFVTEKELDMARDDFRQDLNDLKPKGFLDWSQDLLYGLI